MDYEKTTLNTHEPPLEQVRERAQEVMVQVKERLAPVDTWVRTMTRERPLMALIGAAGLGYLIGRIIRFV